jgi:hypothetical protein
MQLIKPPFDLGTVEDIGILKSQGAMITLFARTLGAMQRDFQ